MYILSLHVFTRNTRNMFIIIYYNYCCLLVEFMMGFFTPNLIDSPNIIGKLYIIHLHNLIVQFIFISTFLIPDLDHLLQSVKTSNLFTGQSKHLLCNSFIYFFSFLIHYSVAPYLIILNLHCTLLQNHIQTYLNDTFYCTMVCQCLLFIYLATPIFLACSMFNWINYQ